jgi:dihydropteroate synthase
VGWSARTAAILRVHDVAETVQFLDIWEALLGLQADCRKTT